MRRFLLSVVVVLAALPVLGQQEPILETPRDQVIAFLALTPDQVTAWDALVAVREQTIPPLRAQVEGVEAQVQALLAQPSPDPAAVGALVIQGAGLRGQIETAQGAYLNGFETLLSADQLGRLNFMRRAEKAAPLFPAFRRAWLMPPFPWCDDRP